MRFYFPNLTRPRKAAKQLAELFPEVKLSGAQESLAYVFGYRDWHDLERNHQSNIPTVLDEELSSADFRMRIVDQSLALSKRMGIDDDEAQYAIAAIRATGNRIYSFEDHEIIRTACWRHSALPFLGPRSPGAVVYLTGSGRKERAYLCCSVVPGSATTSVSDRAIGSHRASFETRSPKLRVPDFVPARLWVPYGRWILNDESVVLFSRNYKPLWKLQNGAIQRMKPWQWVEGIEDEDWFGEDRNAEVDWNDVISNGTGLARLAQYGITAIPMLAEALPLLVKNGDWDLDDALTAMKRKREPQSVIFSSKEAADTFEASDLLQT